jgi:hypothetical protein
MKMPKFKDILLAFIPVLLGVLWYAWKLRQDHLKLVQMKADRDAMAAKVAVSSKAETIDAAAAAKDNETLVAKNKEITVQEAANAARAKQIAEAKSWDDLNKLAGVK